MLTSAATLFGARSGCCPIGAQKPMLPPFGIGVCSQTTSTNPPAADSREVTRSTLHFYPSLQKPVPVYIGIPVPPPALLPSSPFRLAIIRLWERPPAASTAVVSAMILPALCRHANPPAILNTYFLQSWDKPGAAKNLQPPTDVTITAPRSKATATCLRCRSGWTFGSGSSWEEDVMMASGKRNADLEEWDAKIRKLTGDFEESDTELEECDTEDGELAAEIDNLTAELEERDRKIRKLTSDLGDVDTKLKERDRKITKLSAEIRRLTALLGDRDSKLRKLTAELAKCDATIRLFTVELGERHTKIGELTAEVGDYDRKLRKHAAELEERDLKIREHEAEIRRLTELLEDRDSDVRERDILIRKLSEELEELRGQEVEESDVKREERDAKIGELSAEVEKRERRIDELTAELEHYKAKARKCFEEHRRSEEKLVNVTLDPETAHPRLILSEDQKSVRWEYSLQESPDGPERFDADPCVLGCEAFTSGRHCWVVDLTEGQYCAVGVSRESLPRKGAVSFNPDEGIWAVQQWGFKNRALTSPPTPLNLPRVPKKIRISLDYEWGEVAFFDAENQIPIFTFPLTSFGGERLRPWFWVELGSLSLPR